MLRRIEIGASPGTVLVAPLPLAGGGVDGRREQQQLQPREQQQQQRWAGAHAWRAMTLTPGEVEIYSSFMNNAPPEARRRLFAAGDRLSARGGAAADGRQRLQKYVTQQSQRQFLAANQPSASSSPPLPTRSSAAASSPFVAAQASRALGRRSLSWSGLSADSQFRATRAIRKMLFSARRRAAGCGGCVLPAESLDLSAAASGHSPAPVVAVLKTHRGGDGDARPTSPSRFVVVPSRRLGDVRALTGRQVPAITGGFRRRLAGRGGGVEGASSNNSADAAGASTLPAASAQLRSNGVRDRTAAAVAAVAAATAADARRAAAADARGAAAAATASGRAEPRFDSRRPQAPVAASAAVVASSETLFHSNATATASAAGGGHTVQSKAVATAAASTDEPSPPSNTPDDLSGDLDGMSLRSGVGGAGEFAIEAACLAGSSGMRRIEVYMPALAS